MATTVIDTAGWQVTVPVNPPRNFTGSRLTATIAPQFGGKVVDLDSAILVPGYDGAHQIDWTADADGLTKQLLLTITNAMRGGWSAITPNGLPGIVPLFADVKRTVAGSTRDPEALGRTSFVAMPGTDSPAVAAAVGGFQAILSPLQGLQAITATALVIGPQGPPNTAYTDQQVAATVAQLLGTADADHNTLGKLAALITANAASLSAILGGANPAVDTFIEAYNRFVADESAASAMQAAIASLQTALTNAVAAAAADASTKASAAQAAAIAAAATDASAKASAAQAAAVSAAATDATTKAGAAQSAAIAAAATDATTKANAAKAGALALSLQTGNALSEIAAAGAQAAARTNLGAAGIADLAAVTQETVTALQATLQTANALSEIAAAGTQTTARASIGAAATVHTHQIADVIGLRSAIVAQALIFG